MEANDDGSEKEWRFLFLAPLILTLLNQLVDSRPELNLTIDAVRCRCQLPVSALAGHGWLDSSKFVQDLMVWLSSFEF